MIFMEITVFTVILLWLFTQVCNIDTIVYIVYYVRKCVIYIS